MNIWTTFTAWITICTTLDQFAPVRTQGYLAEFINRYLRITPNHSDSGRKSDQWMFISYLRRTYKHRIEKFSYIAFFGGAGIAYIACAVGMLSYLFIYRGMEPVVAIIFGRFVGDDAVGAVPEILAVREFALFIRQSLLPHAILVVAMSIMFFPWFLRTSFRALSYCDPCHVRREKKHPWIRWRAVGVVGYLFALAALAQLSLVVIATGALATIDASFRSNFWSISWGFFRAPAMTILFGGAAIERIWANGVEVPNLPELVSRGQDLLIISCFLLYLIAPIFISLVIFSNFILPLVRPILRYATHHQKILNLKEKPFVVIMIMLFFFDFSFRTAIEIFLAINRVAARY